MIILIFFAIFFYNCDLKKKKQFLHQLFTKIYLVKVGATFYQKLVYVSGSQSF